jgi:hypothetical protein
MTIVEAVWGDVDHGIIIYNNNSYRYIEGKLTYFN